MELREVTYAAVALRIAAAFLLGGILGLERGLKQRPAGLRTYMLVCVGACMIMLTNQYIYQVYGTGDPVRMGAQVVSGIGFLGAGTIIVTKRHQIKGLTTAAGLWAAAAAGLALGVGFYEAALAGGLLIFLILTVVQSWDTRIHRTTRTVEIYVELENTLSLGSFTRSVRELGVEIEEIQLDRDNTYENGIRSVMATLKAKDKRVRAELLTNIRNISGVAYLEEL